eukprot:21084-Amphidinium_carterae.1
MSVQLPDMLHHTSLHAASRWRSHVVWCRQRRFPTWQVSESKNDHSELNVIRAELDSAPPKYVLNLPSGVVCKLEPPRKILHSWRADCGWRLLNAVSDFLLSVLLISCA